MEPINREHLIALAANWRRQAARKFHDAQTEKSQVSAQEALEHAAICTLRAAEELMEVVGEPWPPVSATPSPRQWSEQNRCACGSITAAQKSTSYASAALAVACNASPRSQKQLAYRARQFLEASMWEELLLLALLFGFSISATNSELKTLCQLWLQIKLISGGIPLLADIYRTRKRLKRIRTWRQIKLSAATHREKPDNSTTAAAGARLV